MNRQEILDAVKMLSLSQGFYGRLYQVLTAGTEESEEALEQLVEQNFNSTLDMVMWLESW